MTNMQPPCQFETMGNLRRIPGTTMLRSARPDDLSSTDLEELSKLQVQAIYDMREPGSYSKSSGKKRIDGIFQPIIVHSSPGKTPRFQTLEKQEYPSEAFDEGKYHYLFNLVSSDCFDRMKRKAPFIHRFAAAIAGFLLKVFAWSFWDQIVRHFILNHYSPLETQQHSLWYCGPHICAVLRTMAKPSHVPGLICCFHGKDRTGLIAALLMGLVGASKEDIVMDYYRSEDYMKTCRRGFWDNLKKSGDLRKALIKSMHNTSVKKETMEELIDYIHKRYGSVSGYLTEIGFSKREQEDLRRTISTGEYQEYKRTYTSAYGLRSQVHY